MKAAAQMIVNSTLSHFHERVSHHFKVTLALRLMKVAQEKLVNAGIGEFWRLPPPAVLRIIGTGNFFAAVAGHSGGKIALRLSRLRQALKSREDLGHAFFDICRPFAIGLRDAHQNSWKTRHSLPVVWRKISSAIKRLAVGCEKH